MKKLIILLILIISIFLTSCTKLWILNPSTITMPDDIEFINLVKQLDTPEKICQYMQENFTCKVHKYYTPSPYTLWQIKEGDCNDFSTFACFVAHYHGYTTYQILITYKDRYKHALAVFENSNYYTFASNFSYFDITFNNFEEIVRFYAKFTQWVNYSVYDYSMNIVEYKTNPFYNNYAFTHDVPL